MFTYNYNSTHWHDFTWHWQYIVATVVVSNLYFQYFLHLNYIYIFHFWFIYFLSQTLPRIPQFTGHPAHIFPAIFPRILPLVTSPHPASRTPRFTRTLISGIALKRNRKNWDARTIDYRYLQIVTVAAWYSP